MGLEVPAQSGGEERETGSISSTEISWEQRKLLQAAAQRGDTVHSNEDSENLGHLFHLLLPPFLGWSDEGGVHKDRALRE